MRYTIRGRTITEGKYYLCATDDHQLVRRGERMRFIQPYGGSYFALEFSCPNGHIAHLRPEHVGDEVS